MDAGIPDDAFQQPVSSDSMTGLTLGPGGQILISYPRMIDDDQWYPSDDPSPSPTITADAEIPLMAPSSISEPLVESIVSIVFSQIYLPTEAPSNPDTTLSFAIPTTIAFSITPLASSIMPSDTSVSKSADSVISSTTRPSRTILSISSTLVSSPTRSPSSTRPSSSGLTSQSSFSASTSNSASVASSASTPRSSVSVSISSLSSTATSRSLGSVSSATHSTSASSAMSQRPPSETVIAPPMPANLNVHPPTFYVGIGLGSVVAVALLVAFFAWWIRRQTQRRRRRAETMVPWGRSDDFDDGILEAGNRYSDIGSVARAARNLGSREDVAHIQAWSSLGDRDVGEPRRAPTHIDGHYSGPRPYGPSRNPFHSVNQTGYGRPYGEYNPLTRNLPSHLVADDIPPGTYQRDRSLYDRAQQYGFSRQSPQPLGVSPIYGGPKETSPCKQEQLSEGPLPPLSMADRLRNLGKAPSTEPREDPDRLPSPTAPSLGKEELEQWSSTLKAGLVNAFNAVAANLGASAPRLKEDDVLTAPPKRLTPRPRASISNEKVDGTTTSRSGSVSSTVLKPWTLEEISDGAGIVHLNLPEIEKELATERPHMHRPSLSFGDGENVLKSNNVKTGSQDFMASEPQIALFASSKPKRAFIRPETYFARQKSTETVNRNIVSRSSSVYSTLSARSVGQPWRGVSKLSRIPSASDYTKSNDSRDHEDMDSVVIAPDTISRLSSSDSSVMMLSAGGSLLDSKSSVDMAAARALKERQKRVD